MPVFDDRRKRLFCPTAAPKSPKVILRTVRLFEPDGGDGLLGDVPQDAVHAGNSLDDPMIEKGSWALMPPDGSPFPWRTANDADYDITGGLTPQGAYRSVVWGNRQTYLFAWLPEACGKTELITPWGFPAVAPRWHFTGQEGKPVELLVFSGAQEVEVFVNGESIGRKEVSRERPLPCSARFITVYRPGRVEAVSYTDGQEVGRASLETAGPAVRLRLVPEKTAMKADGEDLAYVEIRAEDERGNIVPDAEITLTAQVTGPAELAGFGTANPITDEDYTDNETVTYRGRALAIIRPGTEAGEVRLTVSGKGIPECAATLRCVPDKE